LPCMQPLDCEDKQSHGNYAAGSKMA
jgi:hypothetical protein